MQHLGFRPPPLPRRSSAARTPARRRVPQPPPPSPPHPNLRRLTSRIVDLARRRQLDQVFEELEAAKKRYGRLNTIVMNAALDACVHCRDVDAGLRLFDEMSRGCGADSITYGILLKGLGQARRVDEAFQMLESLEKDVAVGGIKLSPQLIYGLLNALLEAGDIRRANALVARYRLVLRDDCRSVILYNLLMKGYINSGFPLGALTLRDEIIRQGLKPDKMTYNTLVFACVKSRRMDDAVQLLAEMKEEAREANSSDLFPDAVTYTTLLKGLANNKDLLSVQKIVVEMKSSPNLLIDRTAYTAIVDTLLDCDSISGALCIYGEIIKQVGVDNNLKPKPHLYLSLMRAFATKGDYNMTKKLHAHMWSDSSGSISLSAQREANELMMEAALNNNKVDVAGEILFKIIRKFGGFSWTSRGGMVAMRVEASSGFTSSMFSPHILPQVSLSDPIEKHMMTFEETKPLRAELALEKVVMRFFSDSVVPVVDEWGSCVGLLHRVDCDKLDALISTMMRGPPPCVSISTSVGRVMNLILEKKYEVIVVVRSNNVSDTRFGSISRPVGAFTRNNLFKLAFPSSEAREPWLSENIDRLQSPRRDSELGWANSEF